ncbi:amidase domain-containing protein [Virgibacillus sp. W0430]|uniref:amidase domain-containing protein n=1 Tax=Virgibacillus sp. W0430 TaxID=3391580 RepID=UPI003F454D4A
MNRIKEEWLAFFQQEHGEENWWTRKRKLFRTRNAEIVRIRGEGRLFQKVSYDRQSDYFYILYLSFFIKQKDCFYIEEQTMVYQYKVIGGKMIEHKEHRPYLLEAERVAARNQASYLRTKIDERFDYDRHAAVQYAERWWNNYNPDYKAFTVDCTNYVSQCLRAGGAPMRGTPVRDKGWWYSGENWSFSWSVAHALRWYLSGSSMGLKGKEVDRAEELLPGDIICYDFQGDGRWDHNTIVTAIDANGMPLVNAHTDNSRHRYWSYEDSSAWTPAIKYKFFQIGKT